MHWIDPAHLLETKGEVDRFLINPHGDADGLLLSDGTEVHFPPHLSEAVLAQLKPGDEVRVRGLRPRGVDMIAAVSLQAGTADPIEDNGPPKSDDHLKHHDHQPKKHDDHHVVDVEGVVKTVLHGPRGEKRGALLEDGRIIRMPPHIAHTLHDILSPGRRLAARGESLTNALGTVIEAQEIGKTLTKMQAVAPKKPGDHERHGDHAKPHDKTE